VDTRGIRTLGYIKHEMCKVSQPATLICHCYCDI